MGQSREGNKTEVSVQKIVEKFTVRIGKVESELVICQATNETLLELNAELNRINTLLKVELDKLTKEDKPEKEEVSEPE